MRFYYTECTRTRTWPSRVNNGSYLHTAFLEQRKNNAAIKLVPVTVSGGQKRYGRRAVGVVNRHGGGERAGGEDVF